MASYQSITIMGNLTRDAEVRQVGQAQVAKIGVAVSDKYKDRNGELKEVTEFFDVEVWDKPGVYPYLTKGASILVVGQQKTERWQDQNGQNRETKKVRAQVIQLCGPRQQTQQAPVAPPMPQRPAAPSRPNYQTPPPMPPQAAPAPPAAPEEFGDLPF